MPKYRVKYSGTGSVENQEGELMEFDNLNQANEEAWRLAIDELESYGGMHGLPYPSKEWYVEQGDIDEDEEVPSDEIYDMFVQDAESFIDYSAEEVKDS